MRKNLSWHRLTRFCLAVSAVVLVGHPALSAGPVDPDWPCIQRRVDALSPALMWQEPVTKVALSPAADELATQLALRRVSLDEATRLVADFAKATPKAGADVYGTIFHTVFDRISDRRSLIIRGITRYAHNQTAMADRIKANQAEMDKLTTSGSKDFDRMDKLEEQIAWDERIYRDRGKSLTYVCETPVILEKRVYVIAKLLQQNMTN